MLGGTRHTKPARGDQPFSVVTPEFGRVSPLGACPCRRQTRLDPGPTLRVVPDRSVITSAPTAGMRCLRLCAVWPPPPPPSPLLFRELPGVQRVGIGKRCTRTVDGVPCVLAGRLSGKNRPGEASTEPCTAPPRRHYRETDGNDFATLVVGKSCFPVSEFESERVSVCR